MSSSSLHSVATTMSTTNTSTIMANSHQQHLKAGYLRRQKTMKKKWFVLKPETPDSLARLEYYDDEKKWRKNNQPKRSIILKTCFNINKHKRQDIKQKHVIDLYTKDDCFSIVFDTDEELEEWLRPMLFLQHGEHLYEGDPPKPIFEHVWQVDVMDRGLGSQSKIRGAYRLCLTDKKLSLIPVGNNKLNILEFSLMGIRRCGATDNFLYIEVGRSSVTGEGDIYMATADAVIASNMNDIIRQAMSNSKKDELAPKQRMRSSSATESSKPVSMSSSRRPYKPIESPGNVYSDRNSPLQPIQSSNTTVSSQWCALQRAAAQRRHSVSAVGNNCAAQHLSQQGSSQQHHGLQHHIHHQRTHSLPVSPADSSNQQIMNEHNNNYAPMGGGQITSGGSSLNILTSSYASSNNIQQQQIPITHITTVDQVDCYITRRGSTGGNNRSSSSKRHNRTGSGMTGVLVSTCLSALSGRERCDSLPTRARTTSESQAPNRSFSHHMRPRSVYMHDGPASPPSNCSTDSAGSSLSIDETDWADGPTNDNIASRYGHSLTPDEHVIFEENDEWNLPSSIPKNSPNLSSGIHSESPSGASCGSSPLDVNDGYVPMHPCDTGYVAMQPLSPAASSCSVTSGTPSTDIRFSEYHLDKVPSYILPMDEDNGGRPIRTYSVGSKPQRVDVNDQSTRARAFSVGSHAKGPMRRNLKASSDPAALPAGSPMGDLMELDFTHNSPAPKNPGYVEMWPSRPKEHAPYVDMSGSLGASPNKPYMDMSKSASPKQDDYMVMNLGSRPTPRNDAYVEMNYKTPRKPTLSQSSNASDNSDYLNMDRKNTKKKERRDKTRSKPIAIQQSTPPKSGPPPNYLPLHSSPSSSSPFSSLQRRSRTNSKETPENSRKCPVDARSGTVKIYAGTEDYALMGPSQVEPVRTPITPNHESDYMDLSGKEKKSIKDTSEYVNYNPGMPFTTRSTDDFREYAIMRPGNRTAPRKSSVPAFTTPNITSSQQHLFKASSLGSSTACCSHQVQIVKPGVNMTNHPQSSFKPITANLPKVDNDKKIQSTSPKTIDNLLTRQLSITNDSRRCSTIASSSSPSSSSSSDFNCLRRYSSQNSDSSSGSSEVIQVTTTSDNKTNIRPSSVNSDTISGSSVTLQVVRPSSVNSEKVTRVSGLFNNDLSRPSSNSSDLNSSSSTLVGSRPPSVSSERELLYVTLEHEEPATGTRSPRCILTQQTVLHSTKTNTSEQLEEDAAQSTSETDNLKIPYTAIDFVATDELKSVSVLPTKH